MPVKVYTSSPICPSTADGGATPKTPGQEPEKNTPTATNPTTTSPTNPSPATAAPPQPGAQPSLPAQTASMSPEAPQHSDQSTTTAAPPQPGAAPTPSSRGRQYPIPPPPKAGMASSYGDPAPLGGYPGATSSDYWARTHGWAPRGPAGSNGSDERNYMHPPGYQQNVHAADLSGAQLAARRADTFRDEFGGGGDEEGVWEVAKRWMSAAGSSIVAVEEEIWRRINGD